MRLIELELGRSSDHTRLRRIRVLPHRLRQLLLANEQRLVALILEELPRPLVKIGGAKVLK